MVNDNVQYHGEEVPVDLILSDYAEQSGFTCTAHLGAASWQGEFQPADGALRSERIAQMRLSVDTRGWLSWTTPRGVPL